MKHTAIQWTAEESKWLMEATDVEKPPVAIVVMEWAMASKGDIPAAQYAAKQTTVRNR